MRVAAAVVVCSTALHGDGRHSDSDKLLALLAVSLSFSLTLVSRFSSVQ